MRKLPITFASTKHGFVAMIGRFEISYAHFDEHIGISWRRSVTIGKRRWWLREDWSIFASTPPFRIRATRGI